MIKILVIDDEIELCKIIKDFFSYHGYIVIYAITGAAGWDAFEIEKPSIVILDLRLKDMSGLDILKKIKSKDPSCKVIIITASASEADRIQAIKLGADYYLSKPFSIKMLSTMILRLI